MTATATAQPAGQQGSQQVTLMPFRGGTQPTIKPTGNTQTFTMSTSAQAAQTVQIPPNNILRCIYVEVSATYPSNAVATIAWARPEQALAMIQSLNFADAGGTSIWGTLSGDELNLAMKYFGYFPHGDARGNAVYSAVTTSTPTGANFVIRIPVEAVHRTGIGSLQNQSTNSPLTLDYTINTIANVFTTPPTNPAVVTVTIRLGGYWAGSNGQASPTPAAFGTTQYCNRATYAGLAGASTFNLGSVGMGNPWRNLLLYNQTGSARNVSNWPSPLTVQYRGNLWFTRTVNSWQNEMSDLFDLRSSTIDTAAGLDTGVFVEALNADFDLGAGAELGLGYLGTAVGDAIELNGTWGSTSTLVQLVNYLSVNGAVSAVQAAS